MNTQLTDKDGRRIAFELAELPPDLRDEVIDALIEQRDLPCVWHAAQELLKRTAVAATGDA